MLEVYGPPDRLREVETAANASGHATRRTGTSVAIMRAERINDAFPEGHRRAANLEDVFVHLTGVEIA